MKFDPSSIAFDIDDVFADTMGLFLEIAREDHNMAGLRREDITSYMVEECIDIDPAVLEDIFAQILNGSRTSALKPVAGSAEVLTRLGRQHGPLLFVTARPSLDSIIDWIHGVLPLDPAAVEVIATGSFDAKADVLTQRNISFFVEDRLETCFALRDVGITPILFKRPWNRGKHPFEEVGSWQELETLLKLDGNQI